MLCKGWLFMVDRCENVGMWILLQHLRGGETLPNRRGLSWCSHEWWNRGRGCIDGLADFLVAKVRTLDGLCNLYWSCMAYCIDFFYLFIYYLFIYWSICPSIFILGFHCHWMLSFSISSIRALEEELDVDVEMLNWEDLYSAVRQLAMLGIAGKEWHFGPSSNSSWKSHCFWGQKNITLPLIQKENIQTLLRIWR